MARNLHIFESRDLKYSDRFLYPVVFALACVMPSPANAVTIEDCTDQANTVIREGANLSDANFEVENFFDNFDRYISQVNEIADKDLALDNLNILLGQQPTDKFDESTLELQFCVLQSRLVELGGAEVPDDAPAVAVAEAEEVVDEAEDLSSPPTIIGSRQSWFTTEDYPAAALRERRQGIVKYDLTIGANGKVLGCQASGPPGSSDLELATCEAIMARARFNPATDIGGNPKKGEVSGEINWSL